MIPHRCRDQIVSNLRIGLGLIAQGLSSYERIVLGASIRWDRRRVDVGIDATVTINDVHGLNLSRILAAYIRG